MREASKLPTRTSTAASATSPSDPVERGLIAAKAMSKALTAEHKRWNIPLLTWKNGQVVVVKVK